ncbi:MAG: HNH endonuclease [Bacteroidales bacterium]|nr:HNH endonuclease [Bacteroidales bacterium]
MKYIHRLVAQAFLPNPSHLPQINHKDENKTNNAVENLEWCDCRYNVNYGSAKARISQSHKELKKNSRPVVQIKDGETIATFGNCAIAGRETGIDASAITKVCLGRKRFKTAGGYVWRFLYPRPKAEGDWITLDDLLAQS